MDGFKTTASIPLYASLTFDYLFCFFLAKFGKLYFSRKLPVFRKISIFQLLGGYRYVFLWFEKVNCVYIYTLLLFLILLTCDFLLFFLMLSYQKYI
jgi:hypothetical protein